MAGLTSKGLVIKRFSEILSDIEDKERDQIHPDIDTSDNQLLGQLNNIFGDEFSQIWELLPAVVDSFNPKTAEGKYLDDIGLIMGIYRVFGVPSATSSQRFYGVNGDIIPAGTVLENSISGQRVATLSALTLSTSSCLSASYTAKDVLANEEYTVFIDQTPYSFTTGSNPTKASIAVGLQLIINSDSNQDAVASVDGETLTIASGNNTTRITLSSITYISPDVIENEVDTRAIEDGAVIIPAGTVTTIVTQTPSGVTTSNRLAYDTGSDQENDDEYRVRLLAGSTTRGKATPNSIRSALASVDGVEDVILEINNSGMPDSEGRPSHSIEAIIRGGLDSDIASTIWDFYGAGIQSTGDLTVSTTDLIGNVQSVSFSRPTTQSIAVRVTYGTYDEESLQVDVIERIRNAIVEYVGDLSIGVDIIPTRLIVPIYENTTGLGSVSIEVQALAASEQTPVEGDWQAFPIEISSKQKATITVSDVYLVEV